MNLTLIRIPALFFFFVLLPMVPLRATHIVGGEMNYTCLGNDEYEISLTIFRDCYNGDPRAWFDDPASIGVFNARDELLFEIRVPLIGNDTLAPVLSGECLVVPPDVCVHTTTYRSIVKLPPVIGGYQLAYQRCCRNQTIVNIVDPLATGATYGVTISEKALLECNSNPKFREWPPIYICAGEPIHFDQSATDLDGDSIVYRLCTPLAGANQQIPQPQPPNPPPYREIGWLAPPYGLENMLNGFPGDEPLRIDPQTGLLTGLPNTIGQFVVGICVEEYRDGELISTTRRDFQYNVGQCTRTVAAFFAPDISCDGLTVSFRNESEEASDFLWLFSQEEEVLDMSREDSPSYTFPDTGRYEVTLIANPSETCSDTFTREILIRYPSLQVDFDWRLEDCSDSLRIAVRDRSTDSLSTIARRRWALDPGGFSSEGIESVFVVPAARNYTLQLSVEAANGCKLTEAIDIEVDIVESRLSGDTLLVCRGDSLRINPQYDPRYEYRWEESEWIADAADPNPLIAPLENVTLTVAIVDPVSGCRAERRVPLIAPPPPELVLPEDTVICETEWLLVAGGDETRQSITWSANRDFTDIIGTGDSLLIRPRGTQTYYVTVSDVFGCRAADSVQVTGHGIELELPPPVSLCLGEEVELRARALDETDSIDWSWELDGGQIRGAGTPMPRVTPQRIGVQPVLLQAENQFGCRREEQVLITVLDTLPADLNLETQFCKDYLVQWTSDHPLAPDFTWHFGDPAQPQASGRGSRVQHRYPGPGLYEIQITTGAQTACPDTLWRTLELTEDGSVLALEVVLESCADTALLQIRDASGLAPETVLGRRWQIGHATIPDSSAFQWVLRDQDSISIQMVLAQANGCIDTLEKRIAYPVLDLRLPDTIRACPGELVSLNPQEAQPYRYLWSPASVLDDPTSPSPMVKADSSFFFQLTATDSTGQCRLDLGTQLWVAPSFALRLPADTLICETAFSLRAEMNTSGTIAWSSRPDFSTLAGRGPMLRIDATQHDRWYARAKDSYGCSVTDSVQVISRAIELGITSGQTLCIGDTLALAAISLNDQELVFDWQPVEEILAGWGTGRILVSPERDTEYRLRATNDFGCSLDTSVFIRIFNYVPPLAITVDRDTLYAPGEVLLAATEGDSYRYVWSPRAGLSDPFGPATTVFLEETQTFRVVIRDGNGCINEAFFTVVVLNPDCVEPNIFVPNAFTPNGDDINDVFIPRGLNIDEMFLIIYNRWGEEVFRSYAPETGWDGTYRGADLAPDVYGYYLEIGCANGQRLQKKGQVTLLK